MPTINFTGADWEETWTTRWTTPGTISYQATSGPAWFEEYVNHMMKKKKKIGDQLDLFEDQ